VFLPLNPDQQAVANSIDGNWVVVSGPGTGKTGTFVERAINMMAQGIVLQDMMNLTFTSSAAEEMVSRIGMGDVTKVFRTFHSFAMDLLRREREHLPFKLKEYPPQAGQTGPVIPVIPVHGEDYQLLWDLVKLYPAIDSYRKLKEKITEWKCCNTDPQKAIEEEYNSENLGCYWYACAYKDYEVKCREQGWLDFQSVMVEAVKLLEANDGVRRRNLRKYISVDECQDTDTLQYRLLQLIYGGNILVVGDENQLVYEWRSAQAGNLTNFNRAFPGAKTLYLGQNYRSTQRLVAFFKKILPVDNGIASHMISMREEGEDPKFLKFSDEISEHSTILGMVKDCTNSVIIARTNRQLLAFQKRCLARGIRSQVLGRKNLWEQNEVKHLLKLIRHDTSGRPAHEVMAEAMRDHNLTHIYRNSGSPNEKDPAENLNEITKLAAKRGTVAEFLKWLNRLTHAQRNNLKKPREPELTLSTVHQAKGREWKNVFVIGAKQGMMPHKDGELLEEHRIFYVAATRAADSLTISWYGPHSQFLTEFEENFAHYEEIPHDA
jgi:DNA helicase-2/ATP-dependent DNA helicase PcrA